jgi:hypothetical protein
MLRFFAEPRLAMNPDRHFEIGSGVSKKSVILSVLQHCDDAYLHHTAQLQNGHVFF